MIHEQHLSIDESARKEASRKSPRIRFSVRSLMLIVLILGGGTGWIVHRAKVQREAVIAIEHAGGKVTYDGAFTNQGGGNDPKPPWVQWISERIGRDYRDTVTGVVASPGADDVEMAQIVCLIICSRWSFARTV